MVVRYIDAGYVKDDEAANWDADALMASIKEGTEEDNKTRQAQGFSPLIIRGWEEKPHYDKAANKVVWAISAQEQVAFLRKLYRNALPFRVEHQRLVKDLMINEAEFDWILRAKTGWDGKVGWWVGWVEWPAGPVFFALNIDTPNRTGDLDKRQAIVRAVLRSIAALPAEANGNGAK